MRACSSSTTARGMSTPRVAALKSSTTRTPFSITGFASTEKGNGTMVTSALPEIRARPESSTTLSPRTGASAGSFAAMSRFRFASDIMPRTRVSPDRTVGSCPGSGGVKRRSPPSRVTSSRSTSGASSTRSSAIRAVPTRIVFCGPDVLSTYSSDRMRRDRSRCEIIAHRSAVCRVGRDPEWEESGAAPRAGMVAAPLARVLYTNRSEERVHAAATCLADTPGAHRNVVPVRLPAALDALHLAEADQPDDVGQARLDPTPDSMAQLLRCDRLPARRARILSVPRLCAQHRRSVYPHGFRHRRLLLHCRVQLRAAAVAGPGSALCRHARHDDGSVSCADGADLRSIPQRGVGRHVSSSMGAGLVWRSVL